jgi:hypothetical protein
MDIVIIVSPRRARDKRAAPSVYDARLSGNDQLFCSSNTIFFDAARKLLRSGCAAPEDVLIMKHAGSDLEALRATIGHAAKLTVEERDAGPHGIRFVPWKPMVATPTTAKVEDGRYRLRLEVPDVMPHGMAAVPALVR